MCCFAGDDATEGDDGIEIASTGERGRNRDEFETARCFGDDQRIGTSASCTEGPASANLEGFGDVSVIPTDGDADPQISGGRR